MCEVVWLNKKADETHVSRRHMGGCLDKWWRLFRQKMGLHIRLDTLYIRKHINIFRGHVREHLEDLCVVRLGPKTWVDRKCTEYIP